MVNDEMLKKLKDQYIGVEVPDDEKNKLNEILDKIKNYIEIAKYTRRNSFEILPVDDMFPNNPNPPK